MANLFNDDEDEEESFKPKTLPPKTQAVLPPPLSVQQKQPPILPPPLPVLEKPSTLLPPLPAQTNFTAPPIPAP